MRDRCSGVGLCSHDPEWTHGEGGAFWPSA
jgi:hypothetical protein